MFPNSFSLAFALLGAAPVVAADSLPEREALLQQARRCRQILKKSLVDFYLPACVDQVNVGYLESLRDGKFRPAGEKFLTLQGRQLWYFSTLAHEKIEAKAALAAPPLDSPPLNFTQPV
jgi:mannose/cellobiose epimerase-like protein (N-acyl-D-glucosamine 2-epimerase family)